MPNVDSTTPQHASRLRPMSKPLLPNDYVRVNVKEILYKIELLEESEINI